MLDKIVGQQRIKESLKISIEAAKIENKPLSHTLFIGFAGGGKTLFAREVAEELGVYVEETNGAGLSGVKYILPYLSRVQNKSILFIDEIHACSPKVFDYLLTSMLDFKMTVGDITYKIPPFTLMGATTNAGLLSKPLRDRFAIQYSLEEYSLDDIKKVIVGHCEKTNISLSMDAIDLLAFVSRGIPRIAINRLRFIKDYSVCNNVSQLNKSDLQECLRLLGIGEDGLDNDDKNYISTLKLCQPAGLNTLVASTGLSQDQIENIIEPYLLSKQIIKKTTKGRVLV